ncbi:MAG TPA: DUF2335 domain-containing protein [Vicinamibacterales bacterium]|jgi:uncharacterized membrane protein|nr:DUF2335 domain-containing protein [Vicinamibacterales bacterium]
MGPLPRPETLQQFDDIVPGAAERILLMAEGHARDAWLDHRAERAAKIIGLSGAFLIILVALSGGLWLAYSGRSLAGVTSVLAAIAAPVGTLITRRYRKGQQDR